MREKQKREDKRAEEMRRGEATSKQKERPEDRETHFPAAAKHGFRTRVAHKQPRLPKAGCSAQTHLI